MKVVAVLGMYIIFVEHMRGSMSRKGFYLACGYECVWGGLWCSYPCSHACSCVMLCPVFGA